MGDRWGDEELISFIELGGLGHWGEWHVDSTAGVRQLPDESVRERYVVPWLSAFPNANLLMRRPFRIASENDLGLYNDMAGNCEATQEWLDWIDSGGIYSETGENDLVMMSDAWETAPIGGELTSSDSLSSLLGDKLSQTTSLVAQSHTTFLGPKVAEDIGDNKTGYNELLKNMGYRLWVTSASIKQESTQKVVLNITLKNSGVAPFYRNWTTYVYLKNKGTNRIKRIKLDLNVAKILPNEEKSIPIELPISNVKKLRENYSISLGIVDPMTNKNAIHFAVSGQETADTLLLFD